jgi:hypothetical protein
VLPIGKNLGFVAVGAYGLIASFVAGLFSRPRGVPTGSAGILAGFLRPIAAGKDAGAPGQAYRVLAWVTCVLLLVAHIPGAIAGRVVGAKVIPWVLEAMNRFGSPADATEAEGKHVVVVNAPCAAMIAYAPAIKAYHHQPLPRSTRTLVPGCTGFDAQRTDDRTLVLQAKAPDIFSCDDIGSVHAIYVFRTSNLLIPAPRCKTGDRYELGYLTVDVLESGTSGLPSRVAFRFDAPLDSPEFAWRWFDWRTWSYQPFKVPAIGERVTLAGPPTR